MSKTYEAYHEVMGRFGGEDGFYAAVDAGRVTPTSEDWQRFYVPTRHACCLLADIKRKLAAAAGQIPDDIRLSLARIEGVLLRRQVL